MINVKTAKSEITDVIETIEKWIPMFEQGNAPAVLADVMELLDSQKEEIARLTEGQPVHCKDCEIRDKGMACVCSTGDDWFCADGKQKERGDHD